jgi:hypothetical protein
MLVRRLRLNSGLAFDFAEGARASPRRSTASQHKRHSFRPRHSAHTPDDASARPDMRAAAETPGTPASGRALTRETRAELKAGRPPAREL